MHVQIGATGEVHIEAITVDSNHPPIIYVTGDPTIDWAITVSPKGLPDIGQRLKVATRACQHHGGAILLHRLVTRSTERVYLSKGLPPTSDVRSPFAITYPKIDDTTLHHTYNTIRETAPESTGPASEKPARWRIDQFFGITRAHSLDKYQVRLGKRSDGQRLAVVVVDDAGLGFGESAAKEGLLELVRGEPTWIVYKLGCTSISSRRRDSLWNTIARELKSPDNSLASRLIAVVKVASLREAGAEVSADLSWERSAQDILAEIQRNPNLKTLQTCPRIIVSFGPVGALLIDNFHPGKYSLYFDSQLMEGPWLRKQKGTGHMFGYGAALVAELAARLSVCPLNSSPDTESRRSETLDPMAIHECLDAGIKSALAETAKIDEGFTKEAGPKLLFPLDTGAPLADDEIEAAASRIGVARRVPNPILTDPPPSASWSILDKRLRGGNPYDLAVRVIRDGPKALVDVPIARFGKLVTADRNEIEGLRSLRKLITEYLDDDGKTKPRSVAVFGAPGDGKSFAVSQVVAELESERGKKEDGPPPLQFNLSQFSETDNLIDAFHQVRDRSLRGEMPLVFWDEFDTSFRGERLPWLRYFLSPMQDGSFQQGQIVRPIGRAIFVFAGGIFSTFKDFNTAVLQPEYIDSKAVDFISRLSGYLDIAGLNASDDKLIDEPSRLIHRALLLHGLLEDLRKSGRITTVEDDVEYGVARAFLEIPRYRYGARSMRTIVDMSDLRPGEKYSRSSLPPPTQLQLHVDAEEFARIARRPEGWPK
ncbi:hypothetical protein ACFVVX_21930 [Kitasatospora sp. NPDC058170]|uniref:hypothetical protein n=1 Tax=Kitasatospora sp. NPDC058170 TaxID=3346364 RepID=UPI0036DEFDCD